MVLLVCWMRFCPQRARIYESTFRQVCFIYYLAICCLLVSLHLNYLVELLSNVVVMCPTSSVFRPRFELLPLAFGLVVSILLVRVVTLAAVLRGVAVEVLLVVCGLIVVLRVHPSRQDVLNPVLQLLGGGQVLVVGHVQPHAVGLEQGSNQQGHGGLIRDWEVLMSTPLLTSVTFTTPI